MELHLILIFTLCLLFSNKSNGALPEEVYWKSKLPNTPLPKALQELLQPENLSISSEIEKPLDYYESRPFSEIDFNIGYSNINRIASTTTTVFLLHDNLFPGNRMYLNFKKAYNTSKFLPRKIAQSIPFSTKEYSKILKYSSVKPASEEAQMIKHTIQQCEAPKIEGEIKYCATSLESLVDFVVSKFGNKVLTLANEVEEENKKQNYTISQGVKKMGDYQIVCHKQIFKYAVFYCHVIEATKVYMVPLVGDDGSKVKAAVICHTDTSAWNPEHIAFQVLKVKPGGPPICHYLNSDTIVFIPY
ncbi:BURP domain protein RD22-like isoform X2 [Mercurialis annua]|uniref:BURP domain protein RD22-like isoform X2 n=1 Tax=Mercurialis annua TaxID=3986 RepID=UPI0021603A0D|nr:BURP domain protein RD22-like isoform X2 [Mercurialis annua]